MWFEKTNIMKFFLGKCLYQIRYTKPVEYMAAGDLGGWIEFEENLSQEHPLLITPDSIIFGENTRIKACGSIRGSVIGNNTFICGDSTNSFNVVNSFLSNTILKSNKMTSFFLCDSVIGGREKKEILNLFIEKGIFSLENSQIIFKNRMFVHVSNSVVNIKKSIIKSNNETSIKITEKSNLLIEESVLTNIKTVYVSGGKTRIIKTLLMEKVGIVCEKSYIKICFSSLKNRSNIEVEKNGKLTIENSKLANDIVVLICCSKCSIFSSKITNGAIIESNTGTNQIYNSDVSGKTRVKNSQISSSEILDKATIVNAVINNSIISGDSSIGTLYDGKETLLLKVVTLDSILSKNKKDFFIVKGPFSNDETFLSLVGKEDKKRVFFRFNNGIAEEMQDSLPVTIRKKTKEILDSNKVSQYNKEIAKIICASTIFNNKNKKGIGVLLNYASLLFAISEGSRSKRKKEFDEIIQNNSSVNINTKKIVFKKDIEELSALFFENVA